MPNHKYVTIFSRQRQFGKNIGFISTKFTHLAWPFTTSLNRNITIWWGFFRLLAPTCTGMAAGAVCLKKPHHIIILRFSEVVKGHANYLIYLYNFESIIKYIHFVYEWQIICLLIKNKFYYNLNICSVHVAGE